MGGYVTNKFLIVTNMIVKEMMDNDLLIKSNKLGYIHKNFDLNSYIEKICYNIYGDVNIKEFVKADTTYIYPCTSLGTLKKQVKQTLEQKYYMESKNV